MRAYREHCMLCVGWLLSFANAIGAKPRSAAVMDSVRLMMWSCHL